jgi:hypothetical protein
MKNVAATALAALALAACAHGSPTESHENAAVSFTIVQPSHNERFVVRTSDPATIARARAELARPLEERTLHLHGRLLRGDGGYNQGWSWRVEEWSLVEMSMELCDGWPSDVEEKLDYWLNSVGSFCPWASRIEAELN